MPIVLVVDDTPVVRETMAKILRVEGFDTVCAANGQEALDALGRVSPDVMLLDIMMPVMDGMQFLKRIRGNPKWAKVPVIVMTALSDDETSLEANQLGANEFLVKTHFTVAGMLETIKRQIAGQRPN
jgi:CheY-like chemotaxis protein